jgi:hypothetical protein
MKKGSFVSRSVYQKVVEENKKLLKDLRTICLGDPVKAIMLRIHWRKRFRREDKFWKDVYEILKKHTKKDSSSINQKLN